MASIFTRILDGELPGRFVYRDDRCFAILTIAPLRPGHTLVIPNEEIDHWIDVPEDLSAHLFQVAQKISKAIQESFQPRKVGLVIAGIEVPHTHLHLIPIHELRDLNFENQDKNPDPAMMDQAAETLRKAIGWQP
ncbi:MAG: HIT family protein [Planctomycetaceae bacterium]|nr:HIT family protein [Planctomycetaceae bacterium]